MSGEMEIDIVWEPRGWREQLAAKIRGTSQAKGSQTQCRVWLPGFDLKRSTVCLLRTNLTEFCGAAPGTLLFTGHGFGRGYGHTLEFMYRPAGWIPAQIAEALVRRGADAEALAGLVYPPIDFECLDAGGE